MRALTVCRSFALLGALALAACAEGITPPSSTAMVLVEDHDGKVDFLFGGTPPCRDLTTSESKAFACDTGCPCPGGGTTCEKTEACLQRDNLAPPMRVTMPAFRIDTHEVTNLQYRFCVEMGVCQRQPFDTLGKAIVADYAGSDQYASFPALVLNLADAETYCRFVGKRLPTEFEWERVAGGPTLVDPATGEHDLTQKRIYPFLKPNDPISACQGKDIALKACSEAFQTAPVTTSSDDVVEEPPGSGRFVYDLGGNMAEWTATALSTAQEDLLGCKPESFFNCAAGGEAVAAAQCAQCVREDVDPKPEPDCPDTLVSGSGDTSCWFPAAVAPAGSSNGCYAICADNGGDGQPKLGSTAICEPRWAPGQDAIPITNGTLEGAIGSTGRRVVRGGSYGLEPKEICTARSSNRDSEAIEGLESHPWLGVRCACTASECP